MRDVWYLVGGSVVVVPFHEYSVLCYGGWSGEKANEARSPWC